MSFKEYFLENINGKDFYVSMTIHDEVHRIISIAYSQDESMQLIAKNTPMLVQFEFVGKMTFSELQDFIDKYDDSGYKYLYGNGVSKNLHL